MLDALSNMTTDIKGMWERLSLPQKVLFGLVSLSVPIVIIVIISLNSSNYEVLFRNLEGNDIIAIENKLSELGIENKQGEDGTSILVPAPKVHNARMLLASEGLPRKESKGFKLFDERKLGATAFEQKINYQRALEDELAQSIMEIDSVTAARVHLSIPQATIFTERQKPTKASVRLSLRSQGDINERLVDGIVHLVAWAVEGLDFENVVVIDTASGRTLSRNDTQDSPGALVTDQLEYQRSIEEKYEQQIRSMLTEAYGDPGNPDQTIAIARVSAEVDFDVQETIEETYDPATIIESETTDTETSEGLPPSLGGAPGVSSNIAPFQQLSPSIGRQYKYSKDNSTKDYKVGKTITNSEKKPSLKRLSVAVMVSDKIQAPQPGLKSLIENAVGFDALRGDTIEVLPASFFVPQVPTPPVPKAWERYLDILKHPLVIIFISILCFFALIRFMVKQIGLGKPGEEEAAQALPSPEDDANVLALEEEVKKKRLVQEAEERKQIQEALHETAENQPELIENLIKYWLEMDKEGE